jgi:hypothetical protein
MIAAVLPALIFCLLGCSAKQSGKLNYQIPLECLRKPIGLAGCDAASPPHCAKVVVDYQRGCEQVVVNQCKPAP